MPATLTIDDIVSKTPDLPALPAATLAVMRETDSPSASAQSVARFLSQDQALAARVLRLANSAFYGLTRQVGNINEAVVILGMRTVRNLSMVAGTYPWLARPLPGYDLGPKQMWAHSFAVAVGAQTVAERLHHLPADEAFTAGLLHNLGKVAISIWLEGKVVALVHLSRTRGIPFDAVERMVLGYDHAEVGAHIAQAWNLPDSLTDAIRFHHRPDEQLKPSPLTDTIHVADYLALSMGIGLGGDGLHYDVSQSALDRLHLGLEDLPRLADDFLVSYERHERLFEGLEG